MGGGGGKGASVYPNPYIKPNHVLRLGTADAEIKVPLSFESPVLTNVLHLQPELDQIIALHASPAARNFFLVF